jgi:transcriptional regulator with XRE-family HTH domain
MQTYLFGENLKFLREQHHLKQSDMLPLLGFSQTTWNNYERGVSLPKMGDLEKISDHFRILESDLLHTELTYHPRMEDVTDRYAACKAPANDPGRTPAPTRHSGPVPMVKEPNTAPVHGGMPAVITVDAQGRDNIIYVPIRAQAGYLMGYSDKEYIENLPSFQMPGLHNGTYRMFEVQGVSMAPTLLDKDRVIAQWVPSAAEIRDNRVHVIVHKDGVAIKRVLNRVTERNKIYLKSDTLTYRTEYPIKEIDPADVLEIWYVRMKISADLSEPSEVYTRLSNLELNQHEIMRAIGLKG